MIDDRCIWISPINIGDRLDGRYNSPSVVEARSKLHKYGSLCPLNKVARKINCGPFGSTLTADEHDPRGEVALVQPTDISEPLFAREPGWRISTQTAKAKSLDLYPAETLLFARVGIYPHSGVLPERIKQATISSSMIAAVLDHHLADPFFLHAFFQSSIGKCILFGIQKITAQPTIATEELAKVRVPGPSPEIQRAIGNKIRKAERLRELAEMEDAAILITIEEILGCPDITDFQQRCYWVSEDDISSYRLNSSEYHPYNLRTEKMLLNRYNGVRLKEILLAPNDISGGATPEGANYCDKGIGFLRVQNILPNRLDRTDLVYIDNLTDNILRRSRIRPRDIVMTITGYPGNACCVAEDELPLNINQHSVRFHVKKSWNPYFIAAFLNSPYGKRQIERRAVGGTRSALDYPSVLSIVVPNLPLMQQDLIGGHAREYVRLLKESEVLVDEAKEDVNLLVQGNLDIDCLINNDKETTLWLQHNKLHK